MQSLWRVFAES